MKDVLSVTNRKIQKNKLVQNLFSEYSIKVRAFESASLIAGWGHKDNTLEARRYAKDNYIQYISLEDGFVRSMRPGVVDENALSIIADGKGIYYNSSEKSDLDELIINASKIDDEERIQNLISRVIDNNISKYNNGNEDVPISADKHNVLIIDQTFADQSLIYGQAGEDDFQRMFVDAISENPDSDIYLKVHPDVILGKKKGCINLNKVNGKVKILDENYNPLALLKKMNKIYTATSQMGFEACLLGLDVYCYGIPFYSGWGIVHERSRNMPPVWRGYKRTPLQLFKAAYLDYCSYYLPGNSQKVSLDDVVSYIVNQKKALYKIPQRIHLVGMSLWKRTLLKMFLNNAEPKSITSGRKPLEEDGCANLFWGRRLADLQAAAEEKGLDAFFMEDGFIRSKGLGAELTPPMSLVLDRKGIYFDATVPSDIEEILNNIDLNEEQVERVERLINNIVNSRVSKYNVGRKVPLEVPAGDHDKVILIPGQVSGDASIKYGAVGEIKSNCELLAKVRENNPESFIIYKIHPDVYSGNRNDNELGTHGICDMVVSDYNIYECIDVADEVHVLTSLAGFEALLCGKSVHCYGLPFYAGWGVTTDYVSTERRKRKLNIQELAHGAIIDYPLYFDTETQLFTTPEAVLAKLADGDNSTADSSFLKRQLRKIKLLATQQWRANYAKFQ